MKPLPKFYTEINTDNNLRKKSAEHPYQEGLTLNSGAQHKADETEWLDHVSENVFSGDALPWSSYHAQSAQKSTRAKCEIALLPLFSNSSENPYMVQHAMKIIMNSTAYLNPDQTPVFTADQPLFCLAKQIQWKFPEDFGSKKLLVFFGDLHLEKQSMAVLGNLLKGSGWVKLLEDAKILTSGVAESALSASHIKKSRYAHEVTLAALYTLKKEAYDSRCIYDELDYNAWCDKMKEKSIMFYFWDLVMQIQQILFQLVKSLRTGNWDLYVDSIKLLIAWFFVFDHPNYSIGHYSRVTSSHVFW